MAFRVALRAGRWIFAALRRGPTPCRNTPRGDDLIDGYRERWELLDDGALLGAIPPAGTPQGADRASLDRQLERLGRLLDRDGAERDYTDR